MLSFLQDRLVASYCTPPFKGRLRKIEPYARSYESHLGFENHIDTYFYSLVPYLSYYAKVFCVRTAVHRAQKKIAMVNRTCCSTVRL